MLICIYLQLAAYIARWVKSAGFCVGGGGGVHVVYICICIYTPHHKPHNTQTHTHTHANPPPHPNSYQPQEVEIETPLKCFVPDYLPAVGEMDAFLKVKPPPQKKALFGYNIYFKIKRFGDG